MKRSHFLLVGALSLGMVSQMAAQQPAPALNFGSIPVPPVKVKPKPASKDVPMRMVIDSNTLDFDRESNIAFFRGKVTLRSQNMDIDCEELEVHFKKGALDGGADGKAAPPPPTPTPKPAPQFDPTKPNDPKDAAKAPGASEANPNQPTQQIEIAYARGKGSIVTIVKRDPNKGPNICKSGDAIYEEKTGKLTLKIFPEVSTPTQRLSANERDTNIFIDNEGKVSADAPIRTSLLEDDKKSPPKTTPPAATTPGAPPKPPTPAPSPKPVTPAKPR